MVHLEQLDESNRSAFLDLLQEPWSLNWQASLAREIVQWRYFDRPDTAVTWLIMDDDRCVAMLDSMLRSYMLDGHHIKVRETADWYCVPRLRSRGIGLRLMLHLVKQSAEPVFVLGGSEMNVALLSKMHGWRTLGSATSFIMPLKVRELVANLFRRRGKQEWMARSVPAFLPAKMPRHIRPPNGHRLTTTTFGQTISMPATDATGLVQLLDKDHWAWLRRMPSAMAEPIGLQFFLDDRCIGVSVSQVEPTATGLDGRIVCLYGTDESLLSLLVYETTHYLAQNKVGLIRCCVSTPSKVMAMKEVGYIKAGELPCLWRHGALSPTSIDVGFMHSDSCIPFQSLRNRMPV